MERLSLLFARDADDARATEASSRADRRVVRAARTYSANGAVIHQVTRREDRHSHAECALAASAEDLRCADAYLVN